MPRGPGIASIVHSYLHFFVLLFLKKFFFLFVRLFLFVFFFLFVLFGQHVAFSKTNNF